MLALCLYLCIIRSMNIFILDENIKLCAQYHCNKHVVKMILETAQLLSTAHRVLDGHNAVGMKANQYEFADAQWQTKHNLYKATHINHPCAVWVRQCAENYNFAATLLTELCVEYTHRYGRVHKVQSSGLFATLSCVPDNIPCNMAMTPFPQAMPDQYKVLGNAVDAYRAYYIGEKSRMMQFKDRELPEWLTTGLDKIPKYAV